MPVPHSSSRRPIAKRIALVVSSAVALVTMATAVAQSPRTGSGEVIAIRELELKPGADEAAFERFVTGTYNPAWAKAVPGVRGYIARGDRGAHKGQYAFILIFDSQKVRNEVFPKEGEGAAERFAAMIQPALNLNTELDKFIEPASFSIYTDYVALR